MGDLIMCITSGGQKMVGKDYSVPTHHMKPKSAPKYPCGCCNLKYELLLHASGEPGNEANKRAHVLIIA